MSLILSWLANGLLSGSDSYFPCMNKSLAYRLNLSLAYCLNQPLSLADGEFPPPFLFFNTNLDVNSYIKGSLTGLHSPSLESKHTNLSEYRSEVGHFYASIPLHPFPPFFDIFIIKNRWRNDYFNGVPSMIHSNTLFNGDLFTLYGHQIEWIKRLLS